MSARLRVWSFLRAKGGTYALTRKTGGAAVNVIALVKGAKGEMLEGVTIQKGDMVAEVAALAADGSVLTAPVTGDSLAVDGLLRVAAAVGRRRKRAEIVSYPMLLRGGE